MSSFGKAACIAIAALIALSPLSVGSTPLSDKAELLFMQNKPSEAIPALEAAIREQPKEEMLYLYLGIAYQQIGKYQEAINILRKGLAISVKYVHLFHFNIANNLFLQGLNSFAEETYTLALDSNPSYAPAYLNRANARMALGKYVDAVIDYKLYLSLAPNDPQRPQIEAIIALIEKAIAEQAAIIEGLNESAEDTEGLDPGHEGGEGYEEDPGLDG